MILTTEAKQKLANYKDEFLRLHPNPDEEKYTDAEWLDEYIKRHLIVQIKRGKRLLYMDNQPEEGVNL